LVYEDGRQLGTIGGGCNEAEVIKEALLAIRAEKPTLLHFDLTDEDADESALLCGGTMEVYVEPILTDPTLIIFGGGHVGQAVAEIARTLGFRIAVADDRIKYANPERFPHVDAAMYVDTWDEIFKKLPVNASSYLLIATRGHQYDLACLRFSLQTPAQYIGLMGSVRKTRLLFEALEKEGVEKRSFERVFSPVGLHIGSETPEEIAVSVAAELVAVRKHLDVPSLRKALRGL